MKKDENIDSIHQTTDQQQTDKPNILLLSVGSIFTSMIASGFIVGYFLDEIFATQPLMLLICGFLGIVGGGQKVYKLLTHTEIK